MSNHEGKLYRRFVHRSDRSYHGGQRCS
jgi:hypothetical protein